MDTDEPEWFHSLRPDPPAESAQPRHDGSETEGFVFEAQGQTRELGVIYEPSPWIRVSGAAVPHAVEIVAGWVNQELRLLALRVDCRDIQPLEPITARTLRRLRIGEMMSTLSDRLAKNDPSLAELQIRSFSDYDPALESWRIDHANLAAAVATARTDVPAERAKQGRPPSLEQLRMFVGVYASHLRAGRRNAMTKTTRDLHMARSTGYRWLDHARHANLLEGLEADDE